MHRTAPWSALPLVLLLLAVPFSADADFEAGVAAASAGDYRGALREWQPLAEAGDAASQYNVGFFYAMGRGVAPNDVQAFAWLTVALENGAKPTDLLDRLKKNMSTSSLGRARGLVDEVRRQCRLD